MEWLREKLKDESFNESIGRLRSARHAGLREREVQQMDRRREEVRKWIDKPKKADVVDPSEHRRLASVGPGRVDSHEGPSLRTGALLSLRALVRTPPDATACLGVQREAGSRCDCERGPLCPATDHPKTALARVEFKFEVAPDTSLDHFFKAIDAVVCWRVSKPGRVFEQTAGETTGQLQKRKKSVLSPALDTYEIEYEEDGKRRVIPVLEVSVLFPKLRPKKT